MSISLLKSTGGVQITETGKLTYSVPGGYESMTELSDGVEVVLLIGGNRVIKKVMLTGTTINAILFEGTVSNLHAKLRDEVFLKAAASASSTAFSSDEITKLKAIVAIDNP